MTETFVIVKDHHHMINLNIFVSKKNIQLAFLSVAHYVIRKEVIPRSCIGWFGLGVVFLKINLQKVKEWEVFISYFQTTGGIRRKVTTKTLKRGDDKNLPSITDHRVWYSTLRRVGRFCKNVSCTKTVKFAAYDGMAIELSLSYGVNFLICIVSSIQNTPSSRLWYKVT